MNQQNSESPRAEATENSAQRSIEEFTELSGQGSSDGWSFDREEIHQREYGKLKP